MVASHAPRNGDLARNPGLCPDWESNWRPVGSQAGAQSTEPHQPGPIMHFSASSFFQLASCLWAHACCSVGQHFHRPARAICPCHPPVTKLMTREFFSLISRCEWHCYEHCVRVFMCRNIFISLGQISGTEIARSLVNTCLTF